jgi:hypothetical protein
MPRRAIDLVGHRFGRLAVISRVKNDTGGNSRWLCQCDCGSEPKSVRAAELRSGNTKSCGCLHREVSAKVNSTHGHTRRGQPSPTYRTWNSMRIRSRYPSEPSYPRYGGSGIKVCKRWRKFECFLKDMGEKPFGLTLERRDNDRGYSPDNCFWAPWSVQARNRRNNVWLTFRGETKIMTDWAATLEIPVSTLHRRLKSGWTTVRALSTPIDSRFDPRRRIA